MKKKKALPAPKLFKLIKEEFSEIYQEKQWIYNCLFEFTFKKRIIKKITLTDHLWKKKGREWITKELVLNILVSDLNRRKRIGNRDIYVREWIPYDEQDYYANFLIWKK